MQNVLVSSQQYSFPQCCIRNGMTDQSISLNGVLRTECYRDLVNCVSYFLKYFSCLITE